MFLYLRGEGGQEGVEGREGGWESRREGGCEEGGEDRREGETTSIKVKSFVVFGRACKSHMNFKSL